MEKVGDVGWEKSKNELAKVNKTSGLASPEVLFLQSKMESDVVFQQVCPGLVKAHRLTIRPGAGKPGILHIAA